MDLRSFAQVVRRTWWLPVGMALAAGLTATVLVFATSERYESSVVLRLRTPGSLAEGAVRSDSIDYLDRLQTTYADLAEGDGFGDRLQERLGTKERPAVTVVLRSGSELMELVAGATSRELAQRAADEGGQLLVETIRQQDQEVIAGAQAAAQARFEATQAEIDALRRQIAELDAAGTAGSDPRLQALRAALEGRLVAAAEQSRAVAEPGSRLVGRADALAVVERASEAVGPVGPSLTTIAALGALVGAAGGVALSLVAENLRRKAIDPDDIEDLVGAPVLGRLAATGDTVAALRPAALALVARNPDGAWTVLGCGAPAGVQVAAGLASAMVSLGRRVVVVDATPDAGTDRHLGLDEALPSTAGPASADPLRASLRFARPRLAYVRLDETGSLGDGTTPPRVEKVVTRLLEDFDMVLVQAPSLDRGPEGFVFATAVPEIVLATDPVAVTGEALERSRRDLELVGARVTGVVLAHPVAATRRPHLPLPVRRR